MEVQKISNNYNNTLTYKNKNVKNNRTFLQESSNTNLVSPNAYYNQVSFKSGKIGNTMPELIEYMGKTIKPFLVETDPLFDKAFNLSEK